MDTLKQKVVRYETQPQSFLSALSGRYRYHFWTPRRNVDRYVKPYITNTLLCGHRLRDNPELGFPDLPNEMWELVLSFFPNAWPMYHPIGAPLNCCA